VKNGIMRPSKIGEIVQREWIKTPKIRPDMNITLGEFVVMPNHFHGIVIIGENDYNRCVDDVYLGHGNNGDCGGDNNCRYAMHCVSTCTANSPCIVPMAENVPKNHITRPRNQFGPQCKNLASIIRGFKSSVTKKARKIMPDFAWQCRFYDHIIRNEKSFNVISAYIKNNPRKWSQDQFY